MLRFHDLCDFSSEADDTEHEHDLIQTSIVASSPAWCTSEVNDGIATNVLVQMVKYPSAASLNSGKGALELIVHHPLQLAPLHVQLLDIVSWDSTIYSLTFRDSTQQSHCHTIRFPSNDSLFLTQLENVLLTQHSRKSTLSRQELIT